MEFDGVLGHHGSTWKYHSVSTIPSYKMMPTGRGTATSAPTPHLTQSEVQIPHTE